MTYTQETIEAYLREAWCVYYVTNLDPNAKYRFGQALWNVLPNGVTDTWVMTDKDFFNWDDNRIEEILAILQERL